MNIKMTKNILYNHKFAVFGDNIYGVADICSDKMCGETNGWKGPVADFLYIFKVYNFVFFL